MTDGTDSTDDALVVEFDVAASPAHAFTTWTERCASWWPADHTLSGNPAAITVEPWAGGAVVERGADGSTHTWAGVVTWDPPRSLRLRWHLFFDPVDATDLTVTFTPHPTQTGHTRVRIEHRGWDRLGAAGPPRRERTTTVWALLADRFTAAAAG